MKREDEERLDDAGYDDIGGCKKAMAQIRGPTYAMEDKLLAIMAEGWRGVDALDEYMDRYAITDDEAVEVAMKLPEVARKLGICIDE